MLLTKHQAILLVYLAHDFIMILAHFVFEFLHFCGQFRELGACILYFIVHDT